MYKILFCCVCGGMYPITMVIMGILGVIMGVHISYYNLSNGACAPYNSSNGGTCSHFNPSNGGTCPRCNPSYGGTCFYLTLVMEARALIITLGSPNHDRFFGSRSRYLVISKWKVWSNFCFTSFWTSLN